MNYYSEEEFKALHGAPPWGLMNKICNILAIPYHIEEPNKLSEAEHMPFVHNISGIRLRADELSSGEKSLLSLGALVYNYNRENTSAKHLVLDEPDAYLHPAYCRKMLQVIEEVFVREAGFRVFMATHSVATIALAPESSLYLIDSHKRTGIKASRAVCLQNIMQGVPHLSVSTEKKIKIFVEGELDEIAYQVIADGVIDRRSDQSLFFMHSGAGPETGSRERVFDVVSRLRASGVNDAVGFVDDDNIGSQEEYIFAVGNGERHSIENFLLDPILIAWLLNVMNIPAAKKWNLAGNIALEQCNLQRICDNVVSEIEKNIPTTYVNDKVITVKNRNGTSYEIPEWYLKTKGKHIGSAAILAFPSLKKFRDNDTWNVGTLSSNICATNPGLLPEALVASIEGFYNDC